MDKSVLVIGGGGYIGSHLVPKLLQTGRKVTVLGKSLVPRYTLPNKVNYLVGDYSQPSLLKKLLDVHEEVIHLAYATVPNTSFDNPLGDLQQNLPPALQLFSEVANRQVKLLLVSSGGTVYGEPVLLPIIETHPTKPISPYGLTKLTLENYAYLYATTHQLKYICVRPANAYGIGQKPFMGQGFISTAIASALSSMPIKIFGLNGAIRDYLYVSDVASGLVSALEHGHFSETYNLGSGVGLSNMDIVNILKPIMLRSGCDLQVEHLPERPFDVSANVLNSLKLQTHTGWKPKVTFDDGLNITCDWLRSIANEGQSFAS